jgi:hydroxyacylglutathione hydrolase
MANEITIVNMGFVNCYLIKAGEGYILVDTGFPGTRETLEKELDKAGCTPGKLKLIIMTHGDIDHSGNCAYLKSRYQVKTAIHKNDASMVENGEMLMHRKVRSLLRRLMHVFMARSKRFQKIISGFERFKPDILFEGGESLAAYGVDAKIVFVPGHTPGSIGVLLGNGDFIAGDTLNNGGKPGTAVIVSDEALLAESIKKIRELNAGTVYPGHGKPFRAALLFK